MQPVGGESKINSLLKSILKEENVDNVIEKVQQIKNIISKNSDLKTNNLLNEKIFRTIKDMSNQLIKNQCMKILGFKLPVDLTIKENELKKKGENLWDEIDNKEIKKLVIEREGEPIIYEERVLQQLLEKTPPVESLTKMYTLEFDEGKTLQETKANLLLCGKHFEVFLNVPQFQETQEKKLKFTLFSSEVFEAILQEVKTGKRDLKPDKFEELKIAADYLEYNPIPEGAFGPKQWEKYFPVRIVDKIDLVPRNIHEILESEDPWEKGKKIKDTCMFFYRPEKVMIKSKKGEEELYLTLKGAEKLAYRLTDKEGNKVRFRRDEEKLPFSKIRDEIDKLTEAKSGWVLMRKKEFDIAHYLEKIDEKDFERPKAMDAILLKILYLAKTGEYLNIETDPKFMMCQEKYKKEGPVVVGNFIDSKLVIDFTHWYTVNTVFGMDRGRSWKF